VLPFSNATRPLVLASLDSFLVHGGESRCGEQWKGPYMRPVPPDPWGRAFVAGVRGYSQPAGRVWVLSAGPNGAIETGPDDAEPVGDDLGVIVSSR
jgi:hypothetical protein